MMAIARGPSDTMCGPILQPMRKDTARNVNLAQPSTSTHSAPRIRSRGKESYQNFDRIDKIAMPLVNSNCVVNSVHYEDLSDFESRGRCAKIKRTKDVDWEGMGQYIIFFSP